ncbi:MAG: hypothetical protein CM15mP74_10400 [Halieaceae bacterium]|nr:MAG: hypothetical protein CM15mP74_10400 [Halieaceae bacterium]
MLSLDNAFSADDLIDFDRRVLDKLRVLEVEYCCEPKLDGVASVSSMREASSRWRPPAVMARRAKISPPMSGLSGMSRCNSVAAASRLSRSPREVVIPRDAFDTMNTRAESMGEKTFVNPRNAAAGSLRQLDSRILLEDP